MKLNTIIAGALLALGLGVGASAFAEDNWYQVGTSDWYCWSFFHMTNLQTGGGYRYVTCCRNKVDNCSTTVQYAWEEP